MSPAKYPSVLTERLGDDGYSALIEMADDRHEVLLAALDQRFAALDQKFAGIDLKIEAIHQKFEAIDRRFETLTERFERRLAEECGKLHLEISSLRTEMAHQRADVLKWAMVFWVGQAAAVAGIVTVLR